MHPLPPITRSIFATTVAASANITVPVAAVTAADANPGYIAMGAYRDLSIEYHLTGNAGGTPTNVTLTIEGSDDSTFTNFIDITKGGYEVNTNTMGNASYVTAAGGSKAGMIDFDQINCSYVRIRLTANAGTNPSATCYIYSRLANKA